MSARKNWAPALIMALPAKLLNEPALDGKGKASGLAGKNGIE